MAETATRDLTAEVDAIFEKWNRTDSPGMAVGVIHKGEVVLAKGYGMASMELGVPISADSVFHVASVSKQFCATSVALLASEGKLDLDEDIRTYVPEMPDLGHRITLRQLIHHTNGLRDQYGLFTLAGWRVGDAQEFEDVLEFAYRHARLNFEPQSQFAYCNTSYTLLALTIERVSGQNLREYAQEHIFGPLGMTSSAFMVDRTEIVNNRTNAYAPRDDDGFKTMNSNVDALGSICLYTSVNDLMRWVRNFTERTVAGNVLGDAWKSAILSNGEEACYGYGFFLDTYGGLRTIGHSGGDSGYRSQLTWFPDEDFGVIVLSNLSNTRSGVLAHRVADVYLADKLGPRGIDDESAVEVASEEIEKLAGIYMHPETNQVCTITFEDGELLHPTGYGPDLKLTPVAPNRFRIEDLGTELRFDVSVDVATVEEIPSNGRSTVYERVDAVSPDAAELAAFVGSYHCPDIDAIHRVYLKDGKLAVKQRKTAEQVLDPAKQDTFTGPAHALIFQRDGRGQVKSFQLFNDRIRYLQFNRL